MIKIMVGVACIILLYHLLFNYRVNKAKNHMYSVYHYIEYIFLDDYYTTRENGALNDLAGVGMLKEIESRGGIVKYHRTGSEEEIETIIDYRSRPV